MASSHSKLEQNVGGLRCAAASDVGMRRASNQDSFAVALADSKGRWQSHGHLLLVADGMGAHAAGELASKMAADAIPLSYHKQSEESPKEAIAAAIRAANDAIYAKGQDTVDFQGMGTTCSCLVLMPCGAMVGHVGDSRVYRLRDESFEQLTFDHSLVWEMALAGHATEEEVPAYVPKNVITRSLGPHEKVAIDVEGPLEIATGDRYLLCSDGLTGPLKPELIGMVLGALPLGEVAQTLVDLANLLGGPDNITVVVAEVADAKQLSRPELSGSLNGVVVRKPKRRRDDAGLGAWVGWGVGLSLLGGFGLALGGYTVAAVACGVVALVVGALGFGLRWGAGGLSSSGQGSGKRGQLLINMRGTAPYRQHTCTPSSESIETLSDIVRQLEDLESQREWDFDWKEIQVDRQRAHGSIAKGDFPSAVIAYCSAVRRMMKSVRESRDAKSGDSTVDLG